MAHKSCSLMPWVRHWPSSTLMECFRLSTLTSRSGRQLPRARPVTNPFQYTGRENDATGLYYYRARYYSPTLRRFISEDPLGLA